MSEANPRWLHELVVGSLLRGALATAGLFPLAIAFLVDEGIKLELLQVAVGLFVYAVVLFALERRGAKWPETALRLAVAGMIGAPLGAFAGMSVEYVGDPWAAWQQLVDSLRHWRGLELLLSTLGIVFLSEVVGIWFHVRARTDRARPQVITGLLLTGLPTIFVVAVDGFMRGEELFAAACFLLAGGLAPLFVALGERRLVSRLDPQAPAASKGEVRPQVAGAGLIVLGVLGALAALIPEFGRRYGSESAAIGALKTINTSQTVFREGDKDGNEVLDYAGSTAELSDTTLIDSVLGSGVKQGYLFRVIHSAPTSEFLWMAAADPMGPLGALGDRSFLTNHTGVIYYRLSAEGPAALDPVGCEIPPGWRPVGK
jgi:hypothetical protein